MEPVLEVRGEAAALAAHLKHESDSEADSGSEQDVYEPADLNGQEDGGDDQSGGPKKGKRASAKTVRSITIEQLIPLFSLSLDKAARALGISATSLKKVRRRLHIDAWPYRKFREIDTQIANTKSNIATQASERQKRQQVEHLTKLEQERQALVQQCINTSQSRRASSVHHQSAPQYFAFDEQEIEAHERTKKARMDLDPAKLGRLDYQNWEAYAHGTFPTPESHSVAGMASYGSIASAHPPDWVRFHMPSPHDGLSQPNSPTHLLSASLNTMSLQPVVAAAAAAAAAGYPPMMPSPAGSTASSSAPTGRDSEGMPTGHRHQAIGALNMPGYGHESQFGGQGHFPAGPSGWTAVHAASGPASAGMEAMHALHGRPQQPMQRTASAPDVLRGYSDAQGPYGSRSSMGGHQQYPPYGAAAYDAARYHGYGRGSAPNYPVYDQHHHHHHQQHGYIPQHSASFSRDAHFLNSQPWARR